MLISGLWGWTAMIRMPGKSWSGPVPELTPAQKQLEGTLRHDIKALASELGERNTRHYDNLQAAADWVQQSLRQAGYDPVRQTYTIDGRPYHNIEVEVQGRSDSLVVVGAHYDSALGSPGANDNASGVAALLALARRFADAELPYTLRLVAFTNEEMPHFRQGTMGSGRYAQRCHRRGESIAAMLSLETIGYFSEQSGSQQYPFPMGALYPDRGNFIGFVGNFDSRALVRSTVAAFRKVGQLPSEGAALPRWVPGVAWSDHASFWQYGYPALMVTDTAPFRYPYYHDPADTPDKIDYDRLSHVVSGVGDMLASTPPFFEPD
jgi:Zn-dependent M28 family amino/carboxypeptidase